MSSAIACRNGVNRWSIMSGHTAAPRGRAARLIGNLLRVRTGSLPNPKNMTFYLVVYIAGHLAAYVVVAIALRRARVTPAWAAWTLAASTPLTFAFYATRQRNEILGLVMELHFCDVHHW